MTKDFEALEKASGLLFSFGAAFSNLQYLPITLLRFSSNIAALLMYLIGYFLWIVACHKYPNEEPKNQYWYTFAEFKTQFTVAAIIGSIAMAFSLLAIYCSAAVIVSAWLMAISNFLWVVGERNKIDNPPQYRQLPESKQQETYFNYATIVFSISVITAFSVTFVFFFPPAAVYIASFATIVTTGLSLWSFEHILENWFPAPQKRVAGETIEIPEVNPSLTKMQPVDNLDEEKGANFTIEYTVNKDTRKNARLPTPPTTAPNPTPFLPKIFF